MGRVKARHLKDTSKRRANFHAEEEPEKENGKERLQASLMARCSLKSTGNPDAKRTVWPRPTRTNVKSPSKSAKIHVKREKGLKPLEPEKGEVETINPDTRADVGTTLAAYRGPRSTRDSAAPKPLSRWTMPELIKHCLFTWKHGPGSMAGRIVQQQGTCLS